MKIKYEETSQNEMRRNTSDERPIRNTMKNLKKITTHQFDKTEHIIQIILITHW